MSRLAQFEQQLVKRQVCSRIFDNEYGLWAEAGVNSALGKRCFEWTRAPFPMPAEEQLRLPASITTLVLAGMGGATLSAAAYESVNRGPLKRALHVLNSTSPDALSFLLDAPPRTGLHCVIASNSGRTLETLAIAETLFDRVNQAQQFTVITGSEQSPLLDWATHHQIRTFASEPFVPGRFSSLSSLALIPTAMLGIDVKKLSAARDEFVNSATGSGSLKKMVHRLAAHLALASTAAGEIQIDVPPRLLPVGNWLEHLIAESLGKSGVGVLPVILLSKESADSIGQVRILLSGEGPESEFEWCAEIADAERLAKWFLTWQTAVSMAACLLRIDPYSQPEVERTKQANLALLGYSEMGVEKHPASPYRLVIDIRSEHCVQMAADLIHRLEATLQTRDYLALLAYVNPTAENTAALDKLARSLESAFDRRGVRLVYSFGPQYLHSVGQFYKATSNSRQLEKLTGSLHSGLSQNDREQNSQAGGSCFERAGRRGHFIFIQADETRDFAVSGREFTFGWMIRQQARLDAERLACSDQDVSAAPSLIRCSANVAASLQRLEAMFQRVYAESRLDQSSPCM